jgi:oligopeptide transport system ATP-binding protein
MSGSELLSVECVSVSLRRPPGPPVTILKDIDLGLRSGSSVAIVGESGSGKSTLARTILGLHAVTAGRVLLHGEGETVDLAACSRKEYRPHRRHVQMVLQDPSSSFNPRRRVGASVAEAARALGTASTSEQAKVLARALWNEVGLEADLYDRYPHELSGGQKQRAALARALAGEPRLLVLDEATSALDQSLKSQIVNLLLDLRKRRGLTLLCITHDLGLARALAERIVVLYAGRIVEDGPCAEVLDQPGHPYTEALAAALLPPDPLAARARLKTRVGDLIPPCATGCAFQGRCAYALPACAQEPIPWTRFGERHTARCLRARD